jgi:hypothetical protein
MTADDISTRALRLISVYEASETPPNADLAEAFVVLNEWVGELGTLSPTMYFLLRTLHVLASGTASYTIGAGGTINIQRPTFLPKGNAKLIIDNTAAATSITEVPLDVFTDQEWKDIPQKGFQSSQSQGIWYDHNWSAGLGRIYPWPIPNVATTTLVLYTMQALAAFADRNTTDYTFPPGYARAIRYNLAVELGPIFERDVPPQVERIAIKSLADIQRANFRKTSAGMDPALSWNWRGSAYAIRSDTFR